MSDLARRVFATDEALMWLGNEVFEAAGATFVRSRESPDIWDANHVTNVTARTPAEVSRLLERMEVEYEGFRHRRFHLGDAAPELEARLLMEGYERADSLLMVLEGELRGEAKPFDVREVVDEARWKDHAALHELDWHDIRDKNPELGITAETAAQMLAFKRRKTPPAREWIAYVDGEPPAYLQSWGGVDGVGVVEALFTHPQYRRRGLARALMRRGVAAAREDGAGPVMLAASPDDTPKQMYAAMGFRPVAAKRNYLKRLGR